MDNEHLVLRTYSKAWKYERKLYSLGDIQLPIAINFSQLAYLGVGILLAIIINNIPIINNIHWVIKFGVVPFGTMKFLAMYRHDGKNPLKWLADWFRYMQRPKVTIRNEKVKNYGEGKVAQTIKVA